MTKRIAVFVTPELIDDLCEAAGKQLSNEDIIAAIKDSWDKGETHQHGTICYEIPKGVTENMAFFIVDGMAFQSSFCKDEKYLTFIHKV